MNPLEPFSAWHGSRNPRMLLVGEAWGQSEELLQAPFVGYAGKELIRMLGDAKVGDGLAYNTMKAALFRGDEYFVALRAEWLRAHEVAMTNVFNLRPADNKLEALCGPTGKGLTFAGRPLPPLVRSPRHLYVREEFCGHLARLRNEVTAASPNLVVALGAAALWGLTAALRLPQSTGTHTDTRGTTQPGPPKILPTFHPAYVLRMWSARSITVADLIKAWRESASAGFTRPSRRVLISPELDDIREWWNHAGAALRRGTECISCDIETKGGQITSVGFAVGCANGLVVPFVEVAGNLPVYRSYWRTAADELAARRLVRSILASPWPKLFQYGLYDIQWLLRDGFAVRNAADDTVLLHYAIHPEMRKGLGFLGSLYTNEPSWKLMRKRGKDEEAKADE
jgi:uracil-DNA glycosylase